jgi:hypothetical protein
MTNGVMRFSTITTNGGKHKAGKEAKTEKPTPSQPSLDPASPAADMAEGRIPLYICTKRL